MFLQIRLIGWNVVTVKVVDYNRPTHYNYSYGTTNWRCNMTTYKDSIELLDKKIARKFNIPPLNVGLTTTTSKEEYEVAFREFWNTYILNMTSRYKI